MMDELFGFVNGTGASSSNGQSSRHKAPGRKKQNRKLGKNLIEGLESRLLLSSAVQVEGFVPAGFVNSSTLVAITSGEVAPNATTFTDFGATSAGTNLTRTYTITNTGNTTLNLSGSPLVTLTGDTTDFSVTTEPNATVGAGLTTTFTVTYTPNATGEHTATVSIPSDDPATPFTFEIQADDLSTTQSGVTIATTGTGTGTGAADGQLLTIDYLGFLNNGDEFDSSASHGSSFQFILGVSSVIQGWQNGLVGLETGQSRTMVIPSTLGYGTPGNGSTIPGGATLIFNTTLDNVTSVSGNSAAIASGETSPTTNNATDFGAFTSVSQSPVTHTFTLTATDGSLSLGSPAISISGASSFVVTQPSIIGGVGTFTATYTPSVGTADATITVKNANGSEPNMTFEVQAEGPATSQVSTLTIQGDNSDATVPITTGETSPTYTSWTDFGQTVSGGSVLLTREYTITNSGNATLDLSGSPLVSITGANSADFKVLSQPTTSVLAPGGTTTFTIQFSPSAPSVRTATVTIASNDAASPFTFKIQGEGVQANTTSDGLQLAELGAGTGAVSQTGEILVINYTGYLTDGTKFDSSLNPGRTPFQFALGDGSVIKGWDEGMQGMQVGESLTLVIPSALGYGTAGSGSIPANATLIFTTSLLQIVSVSSLPGNVLIPNEQTVASLTNHTDFGAFASTSANSVTDQYMITDDGGTLATFLSGAGVTISGSSAFTLLSQVNATTGIFSVEYTPTKGITGSTITIHSANTQSNSNIVFGVQAEGPSATAGTTGPVLSLIGDNEFASIPILNGSTATNAQQIWTNFGEASSGGSVPVTREYTITNSGTSTLNLLGASPVTILAQGRLISRSRRSRARPASLRARRRRLRFNSRRLLPVRVARWFRSIRTIRRIRSPSRSPARAWPRRRRQTVFRSRRPPRASTPGAGRRAAGHQLFRFPYRRHRIRQLSVPGPHGIPICSWGQHGHSRLGRGIGWNEGGRIADVGDSVGSGIRQQRIGSDSGRRNADLHDHASEHC